MAALSGEQVASIAYQAGFRDEVLVQMVGIAQRESSWNPAAHRSDRPKSQLSGDMGLFQINYTNWPLVSSALGLTDRSQLFDPLTNARAAKVLFDASGGLAPWSMAAGGWTANGNPLYGVNLTTARTAVDAATASGTLTQTFGGTQAPQRPSDAPTTNTGPTVIPSDARVITISGFGMVAMFNLNGVNIEYGIPWHDGSVTWDKSQESTMSVDQFHAQFPPDSLVHGGMAHELGTITTAWGTFGKFWESTLDTVIGSNNPARTDAGVLQVIAKFAARPDMSPTELDNLLKGTDWFQSRTEEQLAWNDLPEAERKKRTDDMAARMKGTLFQFAGVDVDINDPRIQGDLERVASGQMGYGAWTEIVKGRAAEDAESPWSRQVRDEQEAQKQRPIDIENTSQRVREASERWGVNWSNATIEDWAKKMVSKDLSDEDLNKAFRDQAAILYPWKDPNVETATAAAPWVETYQRVMETSGSIQTGAIQAALTRGTPIFDFETELKQTDGYMGTKNGQDAMFSTVSELGKRMGYE